MQHGIDGGRKKKEYEVSCEQGEEVVASVESRSLVGCGVVSCYQAQKGIAASAFMEIQLDGTMTYVC